MERKLQEKKWNRLGKSKMADKNTAGRIEVNIGNENLGWKKVEKKRDKGGKNDSQ